MLLLCQLNGLRTVLLFFAFKVFGPIFRMNRETNVCEFCWTIDILNCLNNWNQSHKAAKKNVDNRQQSCETMHTTVCECNAHILKPSSQSLFSFFAYSQNIPECSDCRTVGPRSGEYSKHAFPMHSPCVSAYIPGIPRRLLMSGTVCMYILVYSSTDHHTECLNEIRSYKL